MRSLWVVCELCHHEAVLNVDGYGDAVPVPDFGSASHKGACRPAVGMSGFEGVHFPPGP